MPRQIPKPIGTVSELEYYDRVPPEITRSLGREYATFSVNEAARHPGIYRMTSVDIPSKQLHLRPLITPELLMKMGAVNPLKK